jgi:hypothetical protein
LSARTERPRLRAGRLELPSGDWEADLGEHTLEARLALLDRDEVDVAVISCPPTLELDAELEEAYHEGIAEVIAASGGRLVALACGRARDGFAGACVPAWGLDQLEELEPLLAELDRRGEVLFVHPGPAPTPAGAPAWWPAVVDYAAQMQAAYAAWIARYSDHWPGVRVVFAILAGGAPFQLERLASRGVDSRAVVRPNVFFDTASYGPRALELTLATYGVAQLVYGSDVPVIDSGPTLRSVRGFGEAVAEAVCGENPAGLFR